MSGRYIKEFKRNNIISSKNEKNNEWNIKIVSDNYVFRISEESELIRTIISAFAEEVITLPFESIDLNNVFNGRIIDNAKNKLINLFEFGNIFSFPIKILMTNYWIVINHSKLDKLLFFEKSNNSFYYPDTDSKNNIGNFRIKFWNKKITDNNGNSFTCCYNLEMLVVPLLENNSSELIIRRNEILELEKRVNELSNTIEEMKNNGWTTVDGSDL